MSGTTSGRSKIIGLTAVAAVVLTTVSSGAAATANASSRTSAAPIPSVCTFRSFSPNKIVLGTGTVRKTFSVKVTGCQLSEFTVGLYPFQVADDEKLGFATSKRPTIDLSPQVLSNREAGTHKAAGVDVFSVKDPFNQPVTPGGAADLPLTLLRRSTFGSSLNATPGSVKKGKKITVKATLVRVDWNGAKRLKYVGFSSANARLQFKADGSSSFKTVKTVTAGRGGKFKTTVKATRSGRWRLQFRGTSNTASATSRSDAVKVKR